MQQHRWTFSSYGLTILFCMNTWPMLRNGDAIIKVSRPSCGALFIGLKLGILNSSSMLSTSSRGMRSASWQRQDPISGSAVLQNSHSIHKAATLAQYPSPAKENCAATMGQDQNMEISHESLETPSFQKPLIFVVEDDVDIARLICHNLQTAGYLTRWFPMGRR